MKMVSCKHSRQRGGVLFALLIATAVVGLVLVGYITLVNSSHRDSFRSEAWNGAMGVAEAGLEEALAHLQRNYPSNLLSQGWTLDGTNITRTRSVGEGYYTVKASVASRPVVVSQGFIRLPWNNTYVSRSVQIITMQTSVVTKGFATKLDIKLNGNNIASDSYDSTDPSLSTGGAYDPALRRDRGDISTNLGTIDAFDAGNANVLGRVSTGPDGTVSLGPNASIGSTAWHTAGNTGAEPGYVLDDSNVPMPSVIAPDMTGAFAPGGQVINGTNYSYVLGDGKYELSRLSGKVLVTGDATLLVTRDLNISGSDFIQVAPGASLKLYVAAKTAQIGGLGVVNDSSQASAFTYYGLPSNESLAVSGNGEFAGVIYAPDTELQLNGGGNVYGAIISETASLNGDFYFHFDESLNRSLDLWRIAVVGWDEI